MTSNSDKPLIGLTSATMEDAKPYADAVERSGGEPWVILPDYDLPASEVLERIGGLLLSGGESVHPKWYGQEPLDASYNKLNEVRDKLEFSLIKAALEVDLPLFGVCRGMHALNVALGGSVIQQMEGHSTEEKDGEEVSSYHRIYITPGSKLAAVVGSGGFVRVNSRHAQAIREPQKSKFLLASAYSLDDGYIEALESPMHRWVISVQFQPERRMENPPHFDRLFQSFVERAAEYRNLV